MLKLWLHSLEWPALQAAALTRRVGLHDLQMFVLISTFFFFFCDSVLWLKPERTLSLLPVPAIIKPLQQLGIERTQFSLKSTSPGFSIAPQLSPPMRNPKKEEFQFLAAAFGKKSLHLSFLSSGREWKNNFHIHCRKLTNSRSSPHPSWVLGTGLAKRLVVFIV